ncbi:hypothetical protein [Enterococcus sp. AZ147]|uniref:hypothetical protein n=1 Tax=Enterococcus sp. AZ147 TaxID=2774769 RepID=UPI003F28FD20
MIGQEYKETSAKANYLKIAALIEVKNMFKGSFPITVKDVDEAIKFYEMKISESEKMI